MLPECSQVDASSRPGDWLEGPLTLVVVSLGVFGNVYSARVLFKTSINSSMLVSLLTLAVWDIILLVTAFFQSLPANQRFFGIVSENIESYAASLNGLHSFSYMTSTWLLIYVTAQRFIAVSRPLQFLSAKQSGSFKKNRRKSMIRSSFLLMRTPLILTALSAFITLPCTFEYELSLCYNSGTGHTGTQVDETDLLKNPVYYLFYKTLFLTIVRTFGPFVIITILTISTLKMLRKSMATRAKILLEQGKCGIFKADCDKTKSLQMISMLLLGKFLLLRCWPTVVEVVEALHGWHLPVLSRIAQILILLNSATNCFVFVVLKSAFESRRVRRARMRQRQLVAMHAEQVMLIGRSLASNKLLMGEGRLIQLAKMHQSNSKHSLLGQTMSADP